MTSPEPAPRGTSGRAPLPPPRRAATSLPIDLVAAGTPLFRIHRFDRDPLFFGPGKGTAATYRFDSLIGAFGVLYVGLSLGVAVVETLLRNPARRLVAWSDLAERASCVVTSARVLRIVRLHGTGLQAVGCDHAISTGPCLWRLGGCALGAFGHADGIGYQSRHDPGEICLALFERPDLRLQTSESAPLIQQLPTIAAIFSAYRKSIVDVPV